MEDIEIEVLISLVEAKPVLWDKTLDIYKDRIETRNAWRQVYLGLKSDFGEISDTEKNAYGKEVIRRWTNLRDSFAKYKRNAKAAKTSGSRAKKRKKYVFADQLQFLNKLYNIQDSASSSELIIDPVLENSVEGEPRSSTEDITVPNTSNVRQHSSQIRTKKHKKPDEVSLEPTKACSKMSFLQSLMPHLNKFNESSFLQFQIGVLNVIDNINKMQATITQPQSVNNPSTPMPSYYQPQYMPQTPSVFPHQTTAPAQHSQLSKHQPTFALQLYPGPNISAQFLDIDQYRSSSHDPLCAPLNQPTKAPKTTSCNRDSILQSNTESASQYHDFSRSVSPQSDNICSPSTSSGQSIFSDTFIKIEEH